MRYSNQAAFSPYARDEHPLPLTRPSMMAKNPSAAQEERDKTETVYVASDTINNCFQNGLSPASITASSPKPLHRRDD